MRSLRRRCVGLRVIPEDLQAGCGCRGTAFGPAFVDPADGKPIAEMHAVLDGREFILRSPAGMVQALLEAPSLFAVPRFTELIF